MPQKHEDKYSRFLIFAVFCTRENYNCKSCKILKAYSGDPRVTLINLRPRPKIVSEYGQEIPQSQTADNPVAPRGRTAQPSRDTRKTNQAKQPVLSSPSR